MPADLTQDKVQLTKLEIEDIYRSQQEFFRTGVTRSYAFRKGQLSVLKAAVKRHEEDILAAVKKDLGKSAFEGFATEIGQFYEEINYMIKHLREWMQPVRVPTPLALFPSTGRIYPQPRGTVLIIGPWNYPFYLVMMPVAAAIAAGNTVMLKPSEIATETEIVINTIINETFETEYLAVLNVDGPMVSELIREHHFDHIFFTGSTRVGSLIMEAASGQLSPVTLELGGKSPGIVAEDANLDFAAKKIAWSKWINAGQTCVAPDYLLVHENVVGRFLPKLVASIRSMYGVNPQQSIDYPRIINQRRWDIVMSYMNDGDIYFGGEADREDRYIAPAILTNIRENAKIMQEEIFGPILPVITYRSHEEARAWIEKNPYPLACYIYTESRKTENYFIENIRFGGGAVNNGLIHLGNPNLPFGGVGSSGMGMYHGKYGFDTFTHFKSIKRTPRWFDLPIIYPPYKDHVKWLRRLMK